MSKLLQSYLEENPLALVLHTVDGISTACWQLLISWCNNATAGLARLVAEPYRAIVTKS